MCRLFVLVDINGAKETFRCTTQFAHPPTGCLKKCFESPFPAASACRRSEAMAKDSTCSNTPASALVTGDMAEQLFVGVDTLCSAVHCVKTDKQFVNALTDEIRKHGAMEKADR